MYQIDREHIAATGDLNLYAYADVSWPSIDRLPLDPIDTTALLLSPSTSPLKFGIDHHPNNLGAVCVPAFLNKERERA